MKNLLRYKPFELTFFLIIGILLEYKFRLVTNGFIGVVLSLFAVITVLKFYADRGYRQSYEFILITWFLFCCIGSLSMYTSRPEVAMNHFSKLKNIHKESELVLLKLVRELGHSEKAARYQAKVLSVSSEKVIGKVLLIIAQSEHTKHLSVDDEIYCFSKFEVIGPPLNYYEFNFSNYWYTKGITHQLYLEDRQILNIKKGRTTIFGMASNFRDRISENLKKLKASENALSVIQALLLGQRNNLSQDTRNAYSNAGAMHILAVSGLHVGIFVLFLSYLLSPLKRFNNGHFLQACLIVVCLWCFAIVAGLSASVIRAVTMFSFITVAIFFSRPFSVEQSLILSMFFLLLLHPMFLFDVGFQLSYSAVFSIIYFRPIIAKLWSPDHWLTQKLWTLTTVSLAAQIGVFPLSIYYFHKFPVHFLLTNLVIVPFLGALLIFGILVLILAYFDIVPALFAKAFFGIVEKLNASVGWLGSMDIFVMKDISFSELQLLIAYGLIVLLYLWIKTKRITIIFIVLLGIMCLQLEFFVRNYGVYNSKELIVHHKLYKSIVSKRIGKNLQLITMSASSENWQDDLNLYLQQVDIKTVDTINRDSRVISFGSQVLLIVDQQYSFEFKSLKPNIVVLRNSPRINLDRLIAQLRPELIIADGSNYFSYVERWKQTCLKTNTPFHSTLQKGAFIMN